MRTELWVSSGQVATMLNCSTPTVHRIPKDQLPYRMVGTHRRYRYEDVQEYITNQEQENL